MRVERGEMRDMIDKKIKINKIKIVSYLSLLTSHFSFPAGQALVTLIFFTIIATTVTTAAVLVIATNSISGARFQEGAITYQIAQSGADNALVRLLRNPSYTGETVSVGSGNAIITVTGTGTVPDPYIIVSKGQKGFYTKQIQVTATYVNDQMNVISQKEVF